jgi:hypothetical protein
MDSLTQDNPIQEASPQKRDQYRQLAEQLIRNYAANDRPKADIEIHLVIDPIQGHYQWWYIGWPGYRGFY